MNWYFLSGSLGGWGHWKGEAGEQQCLWGGEADELNMGHFEFEMPSGHPCGNVQELDAQL